MAAAQSTPQQHVIERYIRAVRKAGVEIGAVEIKPDGSVMILTPDQLAVSCDPFEAWEKNKDGGRAA